jgi:hypothetical protein
MISVILSGQPYVPLGAQKWREPFSSARKMATQQMNGGGQTPENVILALRTLSEFDFSGAF